MKIAGYTTVRLLLAFAACMASHCLVDHICPCLRSLRHHIKANSTPSLKLCTLPGLLDWSDGGHTATLKFTVTLADRARCKTPKAEDPSEGRIKTGAHVLVATAFYSVLTSQVHSLVQKSKARPGEVARLSRFTLR